MAARGVPVTKTAWASRLRSPMRLTPIPRPTKKRPRLTRPHEKCRPPRRTKTPPKYVVKPRMTRVTMRIRKPGLFRAPDGTMYFWYTLWMSWFASSPARRSEADRTASATASRWRIWRIRHHERGFAFAFAMDGGRRVEGYLCPPLPVSGPMPPRQFLSSAAPFETDGDVLRRVRSGRADLPRPLRPGLPGARANQTDPVRFVSEAAEPVFRRGPPGARGRPRTHAAGNPRGTDLCPRARGPLRRYGGFHLAHRGRPWRPRLLSEHERPRQDARPRGLGVVRRERFLVPEAVRPEGGPRGVPGDVPRPPRCVPRRRRRATQGRPRRGDVGPTVRGPSRPDDRRSAALQAERRADRATRRCGAV